jgi:hypothetical protein
MAEGYDPDKILYVMMNGDGRNYVFPRNVKWSDLPIVEQPKRDYGICYVQRHYVTEDGTIETTNEQSSRDDLAKARIPDNEGITRTRRLLQEALPSVDRVLVHADGCDDRLLWEAVAPVRGHREEPFDVSLVTGKKKDVISKLPFSEVTRLEQKFRGHDRFMASYMFNMLAIGGRATFQAAREHDAPGLVWFGGRLYNQERPDDDSDPNALVTPAALLLLQAIADAGSTVDLLAPDDYAQQDFPRTLAIQPFMRRDGDDLVFEWVGSGKYPAIRKVSARWRGLSFSFKQEGSDEHYPSVWSWLSWGGYVALYNGRTFITPVGRRYLDLLGCDMVDHDVILRWRKGDGRIAGEDDIPAMDRWLHSKFRALKRRVSGLPSSPFSEPGIPVAIPKNKLVVRGYKYDIDHLTESARVALVARIERVSDGIPLARRKIGIIRNPSQLSREEAATGIWVGFALETMKLTQDLRLRFNENSDMRQYDDRLDQRLAAMPPELATAKRQGPRFIVTFAGQEELGRTTVKQKVALDADVPFGRLIYGKAAYIDDLDDWRFTGRLRALGLGVWPGLEEGVPAKEEGLWDFGGRGYIQGIVLGRAVGLAACPRQTLWSLENDGGTYPAVESNLDPARMTPLEALPVSDPDLALLFAKQENRLWCIVGETRRHIRPASFDPETGTVSLGEAIQVRALIDPDYKKRRDEEPQPTKPQLRTVRRPTKLR